MSAADDPILDEWIGLRLDYSAAISIHGPCSEPGRKAAEAITQFWQRHSDRYADLMAPPICEEDIPW